MESKIDFIKELKNGTFKTSDLIKKAEESVESGLKLPEFLTYTVKFCALLDYLVKLPKGQYVNINKLVELGFYNNIDEIHKVLDEHYEEVKDYIRVTPTIPYPSPTPSEIKQNIFSENPEKTCIICTRRKRHTIILPCGHSITCSVCSKTLVDNYNKKHTDKHLECPLCRESVEKIQKIYT